MGIRFLHKTRGRLSGRKLIYPSSNIRLVLCGHVGKGTGEYENNVAYRVDKNSAGKDVSQMTFNVQYVGGGPEGNGGDGWLRILEFMPDGKTIKVRTLFSLVWDFKIDQASGTSYGTLRHLILYWNNLT